MRLLPFLLFLLAPLTALAQPIEWRPPAVGTTMTYEISIDGQAFPVEVKVVGVDGDLVLSEMQVAGSSTVETSLRGLLNVSTQGVSFAFDYESVLALWPLAPGRTVQVAGTAVVMGVPAEFTTTITVEAIEDLDTPAGRFHAARILTSTLLTAQGESTQMDSRLWQDVASGMLVRAEVTAGSPGQPAQTYAMTALSGPTY